METLPLFTRDVLVSIRPTYVEKILRGEKTVELRRRFPQISAIGGTLWIYSTNPVKAIVGLAKIKDVLLLPLSQIWEEYRAESGINRTEFDLYFASLEKGYVIVLEDVTAFEHHVSAAELRAELGFVPPQSFRYIDDDYLSILHHERVQAPNRH